MPRVLIAPLDWGLGHATRCIPIIHLFQKTGYEVKIAGEGNVLKLLLKEFPELTFIPLRGYRISYSNNERFFILKILLQLPKIIRTIKYEHRWLEKVINEQGIDIVISDNRYGLFTKTITSVFITHQLQVAAPFGWLEKVLLKNSYLYINRFTECWVPDFEGAQNIAGKLSHPLFLPAVPTKYIGLLSRFEKKGIREKKYDWMIVLSGPEPQRSVLENKLLKVIGSLKGSVLVLRGKPLSDEIIEAPENCTVKNHLATTEMQEAYEASEYIVSRSGYTTVMEVLSLQKKAILIPTPGQTEQEYLAAHLMEQRWCYSFRQDDEILFHLEKAAGFAYDLPKFPENTLAQTIGDLLNQ